MRRARCLLVVILLGGTLILINSINLLANRIDDDEAETAHLDWVSQVPRATLKSDLKRLLRRFEKLLGYLESNHQQVNLDALFGIRMAQSALSRTPGSKTLKELEKRIEALAELVTRSARSASPQYFEMFKNLIDQPFLANQEAKPRVDESMLRTPGEVFSSSDFDEPFSDDCYSMLLGKDRKQCAYSKKCFEFYSEPSASGYFLTHQLLYFLIAEHKECSNTILPEFAKYIAENSSSRPELNALVSTVNVDDLGALKNTVFSFYCTKVYQESAALFAAYKNDASAFERDLFIEQLILCGILQTEEFMDRRWMNLVFSFQNKNGCFGSGFDYRDEEASARKRSKRYDAYMGHEGCMSHESGLAFAYYAIMIDYHIKALKL